MCEALWNITVLRFQIKYVLKRRSLYIIFGYLNDLNTYVDKSAPWDLSKTDQKKMKEVLDQISLCNLKVTQYLAPFIHNGAEKVYSTFGLDGSYLSFDKFDEIINKKSLKILKPEPIFMRIDG